MKVPCPVCHTLTEYSSANPWRPFCSERCKMIDLGEWANDGYRIEGEPGSADRMS
ncbi:DNA gyrase inhibitor YacG, partial [Sutterella wadsworthensis]